MRQFWAEFSAPARSAVLSIALAATFAVAGCNDYGNTFQNPTGASIRTLAPSNTSAGGPDFTLTVVGAGFVLKTVVQWNGKTIATQVATDSAGHVTGITATVPAALIAKPGTAFVNTLSPASGTGNNGLSNTLSFLVNPAANPLPALSSMSPTSAAAGSASFPLILTGSNFLPTSDPSGGSKVNWNLGGTQTTLPVVSISATQIQATVSSSLLVNATAQNVTASVSVFNAPAPQTSSPGGSPNPSGGGGGSSTGLTFTITPAGSSPMAAATTVSEETPAVSADGRYVAYTAAPSDHTQVFVRDTCEGAAKGCQSRTLLLSAAADGTAGNEDSRSPSMSLDGRYVGFSSAATNLVSNAATGRQVYLRDTCFGAASAESCTPSTQLVSTDPQGALSGAEGILPSVSSSGRFVAFLAVTPSHTANKAAAQTKSSAAGNSGFRQVFVRDTCLGATDCKPKTTRISLQPGDDSTALGKPAGPALSGSSKQVALAGNAAMVFTHSVAVDDRVFLALTGDR